MIESPALRPFVHYALSVTTRPHDNLELIWRALGDDYIELAIHKLELTEDIDEEHSQLVLTVRDRDRELAIIEGAGCGLIDALWTGLVARFSVEYESLKTIALASFEVAARLDTKTQTDGTDAVCEVVLNVKNSDGVSFTFSDESRSIAASSARSVLAAIEYFINAERAFVVLSSSLQDARERNRSDLITRFTRELAEVVKSTSYASVIERIKSEL